MTNNLQDRFREIHNSIYPPTEDELWQERHRAFLARATNFISSEVKQQVRREVVEDVKNIILKQYAGRVSLDKNSPVWIERDVLMEDLSKGITLKN